VKTTFNWWLIIAGGLLIVGEVILGAATGFDLALLGISLVAGGAVGLAFGSVEVGLFSAGALAFVYLAFFRKRIRSRLTSPNQRSNADIVLGRTAIVTERLAPHHAGMVRVGDEIWRAVLSSDSGEPREPGSAVTVESVEGVTLKVR
jgi:membrane protein implicated in regulation of membrane protease activity